LIGSQDDKKAVIFNNIINPSNASKADTLEDVDDDLSGNIDGCKKARNVSLNSTIIDFIGFEDCDNFDNIK
jgi:tRNA A37 threonylcarbamoyladenosine synthetase subunit TsaC/SUA5/YrdC